MAGPASDYHRGDMDITEQRSTYHLIMAYTKWGSLYLGAVLLLLVVWFCTDAGFMSALISAIVLIVIGTLVMRERRGGGH
jgi:hypothetical protein